MSLFTESMEILFKEGFAKKLHINCANRKRVGFRWEAFKKALVERNQELVAEYSMPVLTRFNKRGTPCASPEKEQYDLSWIKPVQEQIEVLEQELGINGETAKEYAKSLTKEDEYTFIAFPKWQTLGRSYPDGVSRMLDALAKLPGVQVENSLDGMDEEHFQTRPSLEKEFDRISKSQGGSDILLVPTRFPITGQGWETSLTPRRYRIPEFELSTIAALAVLLTHTDNIPEHWVLFGLLPGGDGYALSDFERGFSCRPEFTHCPCIDFEVAGNGDTKLILKKSPSHGIVFYGELVNFLGKRIS